MLRKILHSKLHMARVTAALPEYEGSIAIDTELLDKVGMGVNDAVLIADVRNGNRFETYIIAGEPGSGAIEINGAAAQLVEVGDPVIILHFAWVTEQERASFRPHVLILDERNRITRELRYDPPPPPAVES